MSASTLTLTFSAAGGLSFDQVARYLAATAEQREAVDRLLRSPAPPAPAGSDTIQNIGGNMYVVKSGNCYEYAMDTEDAGDYVGRLVGEGADLSIDGDVAEVAAVSASPSAKPKKAKKAKPAVPMPAVDGVPDASAYRVKAAEIDNKKCMARDIDDREDTRWAPRVYLERQCVRKPIAGTALCVTCTKRQAHTNAGTKEGKWTGLITDEPLPWMHMLGTVWAEERKPKFTGTA
jgi:hypothetical protein